MEIWTIQMAQWRKLKGTDIELVDITAMTGIQDFAPDARNLAAYKSGRMSSEEYTERYISDMRVSYRRNKDAWISLASKSKIAVACYCKPGAFCHRHLFVDIFSKFLVSVGQEVILHGEYTA